MTRRTERVNDLLREELSDLLHRQVKDPRLQSLVTITEVVISSDLRHAKVFFSVMGPTEDAQRALEGLRVATPFLKKGLRTRLSLRYVPELTFYIDDSLERGEHLSRLIDKAISANQ